MASPAWEKADFEAGMALLKQSVTKLTNILEGLPEMPFSTMEYMLLCTYVRWLNYKVMVRWLSRFFHYLDRYFVTRKSLPPVTEAGMTCFRDLIGFGSPECYEVDFEAPMLQDTAAYYSRKASKWIIEDSCPEYMLKAEERLKQEKDRVDHYLHTSTEQKLLEIKCIEAFKKFYDSSTKNRRLTWIYSLGTCNINAKFDAKSIELTVATYQAAVLLLFNSADRLSYAEIKAQLNLTDDDVVRVLHSLSCARYKILKKTPTTDTVSPNDVFEFNSRFTDRMRRIKVKVKKKVSFLSLFD
ncbi:hypothetical protein B296_00008753 [Ensete ventricosum]|uniref:Cullin family profile domain-containing protein n=1 Tax=Ensete ventricosum TaxID=4639 RepID=A0A427AS65_ENSVE|nr:hypothetical protein B296_00008753 [Ensete ventricosum]